MEYWLQWVNDLKPNDNYPKNYSESKTSAKRDTNIVITILLGIQLHKHIQS